MIKITDFKEKFDTNALDSQRYKAVIQQFNVHRLHKDHVDLTDQEDIQTIISLLQKREEKSRLELEFLKKAFKHLRFFEEKSQTLNELSQLQLYQSLDHQFYSKESVVFHYGDEGDTYFIILKGSASVMIPNNKYKQKIKKGKIIDARAEYEKRRLKHKINNDMPIHEAQSVENFEDNFQVRENLFQSRNSLSTAEKKKRLFRVGSQAMLKIVEKEAIHAFQAHSHNVEEDNLSNQSLDDEILAFQNDVFHDFECVNVMKAGDSFGEIALISNQKRVLMTATIFVREDTHFATMSRTSFQKILKLFRDSLKKEKASQLRRFKGLRLLPEEVLIDIVQMVQIRTFHIHQYIYRENQEADYIYFISSGEVELSTIQDKQTRVRVAIVTVKNFFGQEEIISQTTRVYSAQAKVQSELYLLPKYQFIELLATNEEFLKYFKKREEVIHKVRADTNIDLTIQPSLNSVKSDLTQKFHDVSHVQSVGDCKSKAINRKKNFSRLRNQTKQTSLSEDPMFPIEAERILQKRVRDIHYRFQVIRGKIEPEKEISQSQHISKVQSQRSGLESQHQRTQTLENILKLKRSHRSIHEESDIKDQSEVSVIPKYSLPSILPSPKQQALNNQSCPSLISQQINKGKNISHRRLHMLMQVMGQDKIFDKKLFF